MSYTSYWVKFDSRRIRNRENGLFLVVLISQVPFLGFVSCLVVPVLVAFRTARSIPSPAQQKHRAGVLQPLAEFTKTLQRLAPLI
jgi:hypothetical protein